LCGSATVVENSHDSRARRGTLPFVQCEYNCHQGIESKRDVGCVFSPGKITILIVRLGASAEFSVHRMIRYVQKKWQRKGKATVFMFVIAVHVLRFELTALCPVSSSVSTATLRPRLSSPSRSSGVSECSETCMHFAPPAAETWTFLFLRLTQRSLHRLLRSIPTTFPFIASFVASFEGSRKVVSYLVQSYKEKEGRKREISPVCRCSP